MNLNALRPKNNKHSYDDQISRELLYSILIEVDTLMKLVTIIKMCSEVTCSVVHKGK
jgi:hypothetical protein